MSVVFLGGAFVTLVLVVLFGFRPHHPPTESKAEGMWKLLCAEVQRDAPAEGAPPPSPGGPTPVSAFRLLCLPVDATARQVDIAAADIAWQNSGASYPRHTLDWAHQQDFLQRVWSARLAIYAWRGWAQTAGWKGP